MNDGRYWRLVAVFAALQGFFILLILLAYAFVDGQRPRWLEVTAGTATFPTLAYAGFEIAPPGSKTAIQFRWWHRSPFEAPAMVWVINAAIWAAFLAWAYHSDRKQNWMVGVGLLIAQFAFSLICYLLYVTIEYSAEWRDFISVFGTLATLLAFAIAIKQVGDARRAAEATEAAVKKTAQVYGSHFFVYAMSEAKRLFSLARSHQEQARQGNAQRWPLAAEYFRMTGEILQSAHGVSPPALAPEINAVVNSLREHSGECDRMAGGGQNFKQGKWLTLETNFSKLVFDILKPFPQQVPHADQ